MKLLIIFVYILISAVFTQAFKRKYDFLMNPHVLFTWFWSFCASMTVTFDYFGIRPVGLQVHLYSVLFLVTFNLVSIIFPLKSKEMQENEQQYNGIQDNEQDHEQQCNEMQEDEQQSNTTLISRGIYLRIFLLEIVALYFYSQYFFMSLTALLAGDAALIRSEIYFAEEDTFFTRLLPSAVLTAITYVSLYLFYKSKNKLYLLNAILIVTIQSITSMGRGALLSFIIINVLLVVLDKHKLELNSKPILIGLFAVIVLTVFGRGADFFSSVVVYFSGSFAFLDYIINYPQDYGLDQYHYGLLTFSPITEPLLYFLKAIGATTEKIPSYWINLYVQDFVDIGDSHHILNFNNNTTTLLPFLLDFGAIGIIIGASFLAIMSMFFYRGYLSDSPIDSLIYIYLVGGLFTTTMSYQFLMGVTPFVTIACFYFILKGSSLMPNNAVE